MKKRVLAVLLSAAMVDLLQLDAVRLKISEKSETRQKQQKTQKKRQKMLRL